MIIDLQPVSQHADVCVIGAGAVGITLAMELLRRGRTVGLLEGGGAILESSSQRMYRTQLSGHHHRGVHEGRFRTLGGTTTKWGGQILEMDALDFDPRPWIPNSGWPFPKRTLERHYRRALELEGVSSAMWDDDAVWTKARASRPSTSDGIESFISRFVAEPNFAILHGETLRRDPRLKLYLHANAKEIMLNKDRTAIIGIRYGAVGEQDFIFRARHYVFCLGAIETARLLLQPIAETHTAPWNSSGLLGHFFQDHVDVSAGTLHPADPARFHRQFDNIYFDQVRYVPKIRATADLQTAMKWNAVGASFLARSTRQETVDEFKAMVRKYRLGERRGVGTGEVLQAFSATDILLRKAWRYKVQHRAYNPDDLGIDVRVHCEQTPDLNSRVALTEQRDSAGLLRLDLDWRIGDREVETIREFIGHTAEVFERNGHGTVAVHKDRLSDVASLKKFAEDSFHHMGTARMSATPTTGVVDPNCRLFGIANGFVGGAAVFPIGGFSNPTHTAIALGVRIAETIASERHAVEVLSSESNASQPSSKTPVEVPMAMLHTTRIGFGCASLVGLTSSKDARALVDAAFDAGIRHFDVARSYGQGRAETVLGKALGPRRSQVTITSKFGLPFAEPSFAKELLKCLARPIAKRLAHRRAKPMPVGDSDYPEADYSRENAALSLQRSLEALGTDHIDLFLLHEPEPRSVDDEDLLDFLQEARQEGRIGMFGIGTRSSQVKNMLAERPEFCDAVQYDWTVLSDDIAVPDTALHITHSSLARAYPHLLNIFAAQPGLASAAREAVDRDVTSPQVLASLLLRCAALKRPGGMVLFSARAASRIEQNVRAMGDTSLDASCQTLMLFLATHRSDIDAALTSITGN